VTVAARARSGSNLGTVIRFEVVRTLGKARFWVITLFIPALIAVVLLLVAASSNTTASAANEQAKAQFAFEYTDASGLVNPAVAHAAGGTEQPDPAQGVANVKSGKVAAFFAYPANPSTHPVQITAKDVGLFNNGKYTAVAQAVLTTSVEQKIDNPTLTGLAKNGIQANLTTYTDGRRSGGIEAVIPPLVFVALFYLVIVLLGQQMLAATLEEKENRVTEMILTTIEARSLIIGKILSLFVVGVVQMLVFAIPVGVGYFFFRDRLNFPAIDLSALQFNPEQMIVGVLVLIGGFALFTGALVAVGAIMPTAKDAAPISAALIITLIVPIYVVASIISDPSSTIVQVLTFIPFTAPITSMLRNAFGSLSIGEAVIVIAELYVAAAVVLWLAIQLFKSGSIEYSRRVDVRRVLTRRRAR
jgi:ABC-2 type transport system permease protein